MVAENTDYNFDSDGVDESSEADTLKSNTKSIEMDIEQNDKSLISESIETLKLRVFPIIPRSQVQITFRRYLFIAQIHWIGLNTCILDVWNAHDGIVSRRGAEDQP